VPGGIPERKKVNVGVPILMHCSRRIDKTGRKPAMDLYILLKNHKVERKKETKKKKTKKQKKHVDPSHRRTPSSLLQNGRE
jgi:hypothetical protein